ncbi:MAG: bifunctional nuclease family protein [Ignavibacteriae bacterium]|nr:bifunctional nuclease family protein [Ignavibacteriota bacterium]MCB0723428.1 bifunctional nuclease family protein [Ignavibacteriota bacterium]MCB9243274.1 bifunctional nuclease family protein [Ignavibacteriales bacterium]
MDNDVIQVDIFGLSLSSTMQGGGYAIILKEVGGERRLPIIIGQSEAQAIAFELEGIKPPRPLTHDLLKNIIETFGYNVSSITINDLKDSTFYAKIKFDVAAVDEIDARPSDAIAIALKFSAPIYVASFIMDEVGFLPEGEESASKNDDGSEYEEEEVAEETSTENRKLNKLKHELDEAISKEDYERAAVLRDEIKKINPNLN